MAGTVDKNGILWKSTMPGKLCESPEGEDTLWGCISTACKKYTSKDAVGERECLELVCILLVQRQREVDRGRRRRRPVRQHLPAGDVWAIEDDTRGVDGGGREDERREHRWFATASGGPTVAKVLRSLRPCQYNFVTFSHDTLRCIFK